MRTTYVKGSGQHADRVYADDDSKFCCYCHFGDENNSIMKLLDVTWGYGIVEDVMTILPNNHGRPYQHHLVRRIAAFSTKTPAEIRAVLEDIADTRAAPRSHEEWVAQDPKRRG